MKSTSVCQGNTNIILKNLALLTEALFHLIGCFIYIEDMLCYLLSFVAYTVYTPDWNVWWEWFLAWNQVNHQNFKKKMIPHTKHKVFFIRKNKTKIFFWKKKIQNGRLKKRSFFKIANSQYFLVKISRIGPWVSRIEWCEGHWNGSTYMVVRLSDIRSETAKKCLFCVFRPFLSLCRTASRPYGLSQINALRIIQSH